MANEGEDVRLAAAIRQARRALVHAEVERAGFLHTFSKHEIYFRERLCHSRRISETRSFEQVFEQLLEDVAALAALVDRVHNTKMELQVDGVSGGSGHRGTSAAAGRRSGSTAASPSESHSSRFVDRCCMMHSDSSSGSTSSTPLSEQSSGSAPLSSGALLDDLEAEVDHLDRVVACAERCVSKTMSEAADRCDAIEQMGLMRDVMLKTSAIALKLHTLGANSDAFVSASEQMCASLREGRADGSIECIAKLAALMESLEKLGSALSQQSSILGKSASFRAHVTDTAFLIRSFLSSVDSRAVDAASRPAKPAALRTSSRTATCATEVIVEPSPSRSTLSVTQSSGLSSSTATPRLTPGDIVRTSEDRGRTSEGSSRTSEGRSRTSEGSSTTFGRSRTFESRRSRTSEGRRSRTSEGKEGTLESWSRTSEGKGRAPEGKNKGMRFA